MLDRIRQLILWSVVVTLIGGCEKDISPVGGEMPDPQVDNRYLSGGETTVFNATSVAFSFPAPNLGAENLDIHLGGDLDFEAEFVSAPAQVNPGLGPIFNRSACIQCHPGDGRGRPPEPGEPLDLSLARISIPGIHPDVPNAPNPVPGFGLQLQDKAIFGTAPEGRLLVDFQETIHQFDDGTEYRLRKPVYQIVDTYIPLPADVMISFRVAPAVFGRGLLEAIPEETLLQLADPEDSDGDGISGRPNWVWDPVAGETRIGRFGLKANAPSLLVQSAGAYNGDMGITSPVLPLESSHGQIQADSLADEPEISQEVLERVTFYVQTLGVPARRNVDDAAVERGEILFERAGCASCHIPELKTGNLDGVPEVSGQTIFPYTDMLLHDMGDGLADNRPDFEATGNEWRTPPLWGIGLTYIVHGHTFFLHDGRARNLMEAIMWHGGEAESARDFVKVLSASERQDLLRFLESL